MDISEISSNSNTNNDKNSRGRRWDSSNSKTKKKKTACDNLPNRTLQQLSEDQIREVSGMATATRGYGQIKETIDYTSFVPPKRPEYMLSPERIEICLRVLWFLHMEKDQEYMIIIIQIITLLQ
jgi:hypothetical protein